MTKEVVEYCYRGIIQLLDGDVERFKSYVNKAIKLDKNLCRCGGHMVTCKYDRRFGKLCTECGIVWINRKAVRKCNARKLVG